MTWRTIAAAVAALAIVSTASAQDSSPFPRQGAGGGTTAVAYDVYPFGPFIAGDVDLVKVAPGARAEITVGLYRVSVNKHGIPIGRGKLIGQRSASLKGPPVKDRSVMVSVNAACRPTAKAVVGWFTVALVSSQSGPRARVVKYAAQSRTSVLRCV